MILAALLISAIVIGLALGAAAWWICWALGDTLQAMDERRKDE